MDWQRLRKKFKKSKKAQEVIKTSLSFARQYQQANCFLSKLSSDTFWSPQTTHYNLQLFQEKSTIASQRHDHASFPAFYQLNAWLLIAANITSASITFLSI